MEVITYNSITEGSTIIEGTATTSDPTATAAALTSSLSPCPGKIGDYSVVSASISIVGV